LVLLLREVLVGHAEEVLLAHALGVAVLLSARLCVKVSIMSSI
jgi:hypothetical protein